MAAQVTQMTIEGNYPLMNLSGRYRQSVYCQPHSVLDQLPLPRAFLSSVFSTEFVNQSTTAMLLITTNNVTQRQFAHDGTIDRFSIAFLLPNMSK